jgi:hypothetical protein
MVLSRWWRTYKQNRLLNINASVLLANIPSTIIAMFVSVALERAGYAKATIALVAILVDLVIGILVQTWLHYIANREQFIRKGAFDRRSFTKDAIHVQITCIPSNLIFYPVAGWLHYALMAGTLGVAFSAGVANQIAYWGTLIVTRAIHTVIGLRTGLFKQDHVRKSKKRI